MDQDNLLALQNSSKQIRNPFGFDFYHTWNSQPIVFKGTGDYNGKWQTMLGPLADLLAWHLYQLVRNQYHDEQTQPLKDAGQYDAARRYRVPSAMEDSIWMLITGEAEVPRKKGTKAQKAEQENKVNVIGNLRKELSKIKSSSKAAGADGEVNQVQNVTALIKKARENVGAKLAGEERTHFGGTADVRNGEAGKEIVTGPVLNAADVNGEPAKPLDADEAKQPIANSQANEDNKKGDFGDLDKLDDQDDDDE